mmetsp:Transcript_12828/g.18460  ORF Transcript_12828/g.18460 Transcript_12828/m.18460 type:complete len:402 (+) Transcript_12828:70-1275(+)|eukprot:CAMPEP_0202442622 /NCGR_PEP_ID=MMETSP1360-20130828/2016_1 /ASSEMBLY_ACC=CAM_ASM_000848 /TAXON_ID=515479 /ORGANISM="Licmophora paradoxa, Strain CCMP2313" /LENGTH=401 /DNA_ID=CAMNT_0049058031 /DNA_START=37 /DNA_END=1242 /DNA_ORIENTATION=-
MISTRVARQVATSSRREFSSFVSALDVFPGVPDSVPTPTTAGTISTTTLANGLIVVTEGSSSSSTVTLTFPNAGSSSESGAESGAALINKNLAFSAGSGLSSALILRNFQDDGASTFSTANRTSTTVGFTTLPDKAVRLLPLINTECSFEPWDVANAKKVAQYECSEASKSLQVALTEAIFASAYGPQSGMGKPFYSEGASNPAIQSFRAKTYGLNGAILSATGVEDHASFCTAVEESLVGAAGDQAAVASPYLGGETRVLAPGTAPQIALAFEGPASDTAAAVLKTCLELQGVSAFGTAGLVGVTGPSVDALSTAVTTKPSADIIKRAKALVKSQKAFAMAEGSQSLAQAMTASVLDPTDVDSVDVASLYAAMMKSPLSMAAVGDLATVPYQGTVATRFN